MDTKRGLKTGVVTVVFGVVVVCAFCSGAFGQAWDGNGVEGDPYLIYTASQMNLIGAHPADWGKHFRLIADIDLGGITGTSFNVIGRTYIDSPEGITLDVNGGKMYWTNHGGRQINRANLDGSWPEYLVTEGSGWPRDIALDVSGGKIYWTNSVNSKIQRANLDGTGIEDLITVGLSWPRGIALDVSGGKMYWTDFGFDKIQRANLDGSGIEDLVASGLKSPLGIALDVSAGKMYWTDSIDNKIQRANLDGTNVEDLVTGLSSPRGIALDVASGKMYWTDYVNSKIQQANLDGTGEEDLVITGLDTPTGIALDTTGGKMYWTGYGTDKIKWANLDGSGVEEVSANHFTGVFDGNGHTISNFTYDSNGVDYIGIFGWVDDANSEVKNVGLVDPNVEAGTGGYVGGLIGYFKAGKVNNCYVAGGTVSGSSNVGGLVGFNNGYIMQSHSTSSVSGVSYVGGVAGYDYSGRILESYSAGASLGTESVGGLVGRANYGAILESYSTSSVTGETDVGGLVGHDYRCSISNSYSNGNVLGTSGVGGLIGYHGGGGAYISNGYSAGTVSGVNDVGGLVGHGYGSYVTDCFWDVDTSGVDVSVGGRGMTTSQMQTASTFASWGGCGNGGVWRIDDGNDYPCLWWEDGPGEVLDANLSDFVAGAGRTNDPYLIYTAEQLNLIGAFACEWGACYKLMSDVDLGGYTGVAFNIIGRTTPYEPFTGVFDGNGHRISNFAYDSNGRNYIGLFSFVNDANAEIRNLSLVDPNISAGSENNIGGLVGRFGAGTISNCSITGGSISGQDSCGGLAGSSSGYILGCSGAGSVSGGDGVGGLVGSVSGGMIDNSCAEGTAWGNNRVGGLGGYSDSEINSCHAQTAASGNSDVGGLVGHNGNNGSINSSYATSAALGDYEVGGLVGYNYGDIVYCYSTGAVSGAGSVGGLVGKNRDGIVWNSYSISSVWGESGVGGLVGEDTMGTYRSCFWDVNVNADVNGIGNGSDPNVIGETTGEMQTESTYTDAGWDFVDEVDNGYQDIWRLCNAGAEYPQLNWQYPLGDFGCPDGVDGIDLGALCEEWLLKELSWDVWPNGGDGLVDFLDWAVFADGWGVTVDIDDLVEFAEQWLKSGSNYLITDIAPGSDGDGITNGVDFAVLADNWLAGL